MTKINEPLPQSGTGPKFVVRTYGFVDEFEKALNENDEYGLFSFSGNIEAGDVAIIAVYIRKPRRLWRP